MTEFIDRVYGVAKARAERGEAWGAICAVTYADTISFTKAMADVKDVTINGKLVSTTPVPETTSAASLVEAMRRILLTSVPEEYKERVLSDFSSVEFLSELEAPDSQSVQAESLRKRTEGLKPHAFKARRVSDSKVHARAAIKMSELGVDDVDIHAAVRASDLAVFESSSIEYALSHADWQLEGHSVRMELAQEVVNAIDPGVDRDILRQALLKQFEGLDSAAGLEWIIA